MRTSAPPDTPHIIQIGSDNGLTRINYIQS